MAYPPEELIELRDKLAFKKLEGKMLTDREELIVKVINEKLIQSFPPAPKLPPEVLEAIQEVKGLRKNPRHRILVNKVKVVYEDDRISFQKLVDIAGFTPDPDCTWTITFDHGPMFTPEGNIARTGGYMRKNETVCVQTGTQFYVVITDMVGMKKPPSESTDHGPK